MAPRSPAHLLLPSPLGLLEYDVLEDAVFLGPGPKGGLRASPTPFRGASVALKRGDEGFVARPLPGEANPEINGEVVAERALVDGDRIRLGEHVTLFRTTRGPLMTPEAPPEPAPRVERRAPPRRKNPLGAVLVFSGLVLLLAAAYRAANHMKAIQSAGLVGSDLPELVAYEPGEQGRVARELAALDAQAAQRPDRYADLIPLYRDFRRRHEGTVEAESAGERLRELMTAWSVHERAALDVQVEKSVGAHQFARALEEVRSFEARFGGTEAAHGLEPLRTSIRRAARTALDALIAKVGPLVTPQPREAHRLLIGVSHEFPPDMAVEVIALIESCVQRMVDTRPARGPEPPRRDGDGPPAKGPPAAGNEPPPGEAPLVPLPGPARDTPDREAQCVDAWRAARERLQQGQYAEALEAYTMLLAQYADTASFKEHKAKWMAGRDAARAGALGPQALINVPVEEKKGRLEFAYEFNERAVFDSDWTIEQPFSSELPIQADWKRGRVTLEKATGLLHRLVFLADVHLEVDAEVHQPHDFGLLAVQESDDFRAILFNVANTRFALKKGDAAQVNRGHVLWYIGQGVWRDADADQHGFIKIDERAKVSLESGDRVKLELTRSKNSAHATLQGKTDGVDLEGNVTGDDGSTMGPGRVGVFTNSGIIVVHAVRISGRVDMDWFRKELGFMVASDPGPPEND